MRLWSPSRQTQEGEAARILAVRDRHENVVVPNFGTLTRAVGRAPHHCTGAVYAGATKIDVSARFANTSLLLPASEVGLMPWLAGKSPGSYEGK